MSLSDYGTHIVPAVEFPNHPEWPAYEAPARWFVQPGKKPRTNPTHVAKEDPK